MKKRSVLRAAALLFMLFLTCLCAANYFTPRELPETPANNGYKKIAASQAQALMSEGALILDVRTPDEFEGGHIPGAALLPDYEIGEKAQSVIPDKGQSLLVYCRTGVRSKAAAEKLIDMGYLRVFDLGGITDWPGEIVNSSGGISYNYFGGELPPDDITDFEYAETQRIHDEMEEFEFKIEGVRVIEYDLMYEKSRYGVWKTTLNIYKLTVSNADGSFKQEFEGLSTENWHDCHGLSIDDWNFDGYLDIRLWQSLGGTLGNSPHYHWLWDNSLKKFVADGQLDELSQSFLLNVDSEAEEITAFHKWNSGNLREYYKYSGGEYLLVRSETRQLEPLEAMENRYILHITVEELVDGRMKITQDYYEKSFK